MMLSFYFPDIFPEVQCSLWYSPYHRQSTSPVLRSRVPDKGGNISDHLFRDMPLDLVLFGGFQDIIVDSLDENMVQVRIQFKSSISPAGQEFSEHPVVPFCEHLKIFSALQDESRL